MPNYFANLPAPEIRNSLIDYSPINSGLDSIRQQGQFKAQNALAQKQEARAQSQFDYQRGRDQKQDQRQEVEWYGKQAMAVDAMPDGPQRQAIWQRIIAKHGVDGLTPEEMDHRTGPKLLAAQAGMYLNPMEQEAQRLKLEAARSDLSMAPLQRQKMEAEVKALQQKDVLNEAIAGMIRGPGGTPEPQSPIQPQSFNGASPNNNLILTADGATPQGQPAASPQMIDTPMGKMTLERAKQLGMALALAGKGDAGKMLTEDAGAGLAKPTVNQIEERTLNSVAQLGRLADIEKRFDPKFLDIGNRMKMMGAAWTAKAGGNLAPEIKSELGRYAAFRSGAVNNLNAILKEVSGAAVTPQEYERIQNDQPVAGTGIFDGDDPVSFQAKMKRTTGALKSAVARLNFMRNRGLNFTRETMDQFMSLEDVPGAIDRRGAEIEQQLRQANPSADPMSIEKNVHQQLKREFGI